LTPSNTRDGLSTTGRPAPGLGRRFPCADRPCARADPTSVAKHNATISTRRTMIAPLIAVASVLPPKSVRRSRFEHHATCEDWMPESSEAGASMRLHASLSTTLW
jgi:hypothetical protein